MNLCCFPGDLSGEIRIIPSKSAAHRAILLSALSPESSDISPIQSSQDIAATLSCARTLWGFDRFSIHSRAGEDARLRVVPLAKPPQTAQRQLDCGESGSTLRFFLPLALDGRGPVRFTGKGRLFQRPLAFYKQLFRAQGCTWIEGDSSLTVEGQLHAGDFEMPGDVSSQYVTGLLLALPRLPEDSRIHLASPLQSLAYAELTREMQRAFGVTSHWERDTLIIPGAQTYRSPGEVHVEGDWSHAAFYLVAGALSRKGPVCIRGLSTESLQADRSILSLLASMGVRIEVSGESVTAHPSALCAIEADCAQCPDLVPILAVAMACAEGESRITGAARLRLKESDRLAAMETALGQVGVDCRATDDGLCIRGGAIHAGRVSCFSDHRIVMAMAIAALRADGPVELSDAQCTAKSAPRFWEEFHALGGDAR